MVQASSLMGRVLMPIGLALGITSCAGLGGSEQDIPVPDDPGLYALDGDRLQRLNGDPEWESETWAERSALSPDTEFVIRHPALEGLDRALEEAVRVYKVGWVRSEITEDGRIKPVEGSRWAVVSNLEAFQVPLRRTPTERKDVAWAAPVEPLEPGLYSLQLRSGSSSVNARFGVRWSSVDRRDYSAKTCVDRYVHGDDILYQPCAAQAQAVFTKGLQLYLVTPEAETGPSGRRLIVKGVLVNASQARRRVPPLEATLLTAEREVVKRWTFTVDRGVLAPGDSVSFQTEVPDPPPTTDNVRVGFAPAWTLYGD